MNGHGCGDVEMKNVEGMLNHLDGQLVYLCLVLRVCIFHVQASRMLSAPMMWGLACFMAMLMIS